MIAAWGRAIRSWRAAAYWNICPSAHEACGRRVSTRRGASVTTFLESSAWRCGSRRRLTDDLRFHAIRIGYNELRYNVELISCNHAGDGGGREPCAIKVTRKEGGIA